ncbi:MAG: hypothetical protein AAF483_30685, partial [Planctomycetota bacterium]
MPKRYELTRSKLPNHHSSYFRKHRNADNGFEKAAVCLCLAIVWFVPHIVSSTCIGFCVRGECRQCGLRQQHWIWVVNVSYGPSLLAQLRLTDQYTAFDPTTAKSPTCIYSATQRMSVEVTNWTHRIRNLVKKAIIPKAMTGIYKDWRMAPGSEVDGFLFLTGFNGMGLDGIVSADAAKQIDTAFDQIFSVLDEAGMNASHIVEVTSYHIGLKAHL